MTTIYKYQLDITHEQVIEIPANSKVLSVANQDEVLCIWVEVFKDEERKEALTVYVFGTGHNIPSTLNASFVGTILMANGRLVWHVFIDNIKKMAHHV